MSHEAHIAAQAAIARSKGESPGRCESCGRIIHRDERWGRCPDTEALTCEDCLPDTGDEK